MKKELKYVIIEYDNESDIENIIDTINYETERVVSFLELSPFGNKVEIKVVNDLNKLRNDSLKVFNYGSLLNVPDWLCGFAKDNYVEVLTLEEYRKTKGHSNSTINDIINLIIHEFIHCCHNKINEKHMLWLSEGLATNLSHQYDDKGSKFYLNATNQDIKTKICDYSNYYLMVKYLLDNYDKEYILKLLNNYNLQEEITDEIYNKVKETNFKK